MNSRRYISHKKKTHNNKKNQVFFCTCLNIHTNVKISFTCLFLFCTNRRRRCCLLFGAKIKNNLLRRRYSLFFNNFYYYFSFVTCTYTCMCVLCTKYTERYELLKYYNNNDFLSFFFFDENEKIDE